jgi:Domain of unknown function (DUF397)/Domain of unknown function (DUF5753)
VERRVQVKMTRQRALTRDSPLSVDVVLDEAAVVRTVGGAEVMREQLAEVDAEDPRCAEWRVSTYSANGSTCVEVARNLPGIVAVRDSKDRQGAALTFTAEQWRAFTARLQHGI